jgi:hypothetical protein
MLNDVVAKFWTLGWLEQSGIVAELHGTKGSPGYAKLHPKTAGHGLVVPSSRKQAPEDRVWQGKQMLGRSLASESGRLDVGLRGEKTAAKVLELLTGRKFDNLNASVGEHSPLDLIGDSRAVEVKSGQSTNGRSAQHWRVTHGKPGVTEAALMSKMTRQELSVHNARKTQYLLRRKAELSSQIGKKLKRTLRPTTVGVIFNETFDRADVFVIPGFHAYLPWSVYATDTYYVGTYPVD